MNQAMRNMADGKQSGEEEQNSEQTCEGGISGPLRTNRFSSFLQAEAVKHEACLRASQKCGKEIRNPNDEIRNKSEYRMAKRRSAFRIYQSFNVRRKAMSAFTSAAFNLLPKAGISPLIP